MLTLLNNENVMFERFYDYPVSACPSDGYNGRFLTTTIYIYTYRYIQSYRQTNRNIKRSVYCQYG